MAPRFRVLAIDGGGIRGVIPATVLVDLERRLAPRTLASVFDLIVGTSTGGILALGLTAPEAGRAGRAAERLLELYLSDAEAIFPGGGGAAPLAHSAWLSEGARYPVAGLEEALQRYLGDTPLVAALTDVVVTSYDLAYGEPVTLASRPELGDICDVTMVVAARATSAAPMFFKPQIVQDGSRERMLVDGGLYVTNPALVGYLLGGEVAAREERPLALVSLGTGARPPHAPLPVESTSMRDVSSAARTLLEAVATGGGRLADQLLARLADGERFSYWRIQTTVGPCSFTMDDSSPENVACLYERACELVSENDEQLSAIASAVAGVPAAEGGAMLG